MKFLNKSQFFNYYLPLILTAIILIVSAGIYWNLKKPTQEAEAAWYSSSWTYRKPITIDKTKLSVTATTTFSSFPLLISVTDSDLKNTASGGKVASLTGDDILFTDTNGTTKFDHEIESYNGPTGLLIAWVRIPTLTTSADYTIYIYFGNSGASNQQNVNGTWNTNYKNVWHLPNGITLSANDSTSNANNGTVSSATAVVGKVDGGANVNSGAEITKTSTASISVDTGDFYISLWIKTTGTGSFSAMYEKSSAAGVGDYSLFMNLGKLGYYRLGGGTGNFVSGTATINTGSWRYIVWKRAGSANTFYVDTVSDATMTDANGSDAGGTLHLGTNPSGGGTNWDGSYDEFRLSNIARSVDWMTNEYNNMNEPSTFYSYGSLGIINRAANTGAEAVRGNVKVRGGVKFR